MKKFKKILGITVISLMLGINPVMPICASDSINSIELDQIEPRSILTYGAVTLTNGKTNYYKDNGVNFSFLKGTRIIFSYKLNKQAKIQVGYHNSNLNTNTVLYQGTAALKTLTFIAPSSFYGYFYIKNLSGGTVTVTTCSVRR